LTQKVEQKIQGKTNCSARFAVPAHKLLSFMATPYFLFSNFISNCNLTLEKKVASAMLP
jgi:hypothetical protein